MRGQRIVRHHLTGDFLGEFGLQTAVDVNGGQFTVFSSTVRVEFELFAGEIGALGVGLGVHRDILASSHGHGAGD